MMPVPLITESFRSKLKLNRRSSECKQEPDSINSESILEFPQPSGGSLGCGARLAWLPNLVGLTNWYAVLFLGVVISILAKSELAFAESVCDEAAVMKRLAPVHAEPSNGGLPNGEMWSRVSKVSESAAKLGPKNFIFILADDLGYGDLGCFGQERIKTPRLDQLAKQGMRMTSFYSGSTVCAPSRSCLMTGQHTGHTLVRGNSKTNLRPEDVTLAEVMKSKGYRTGLFGKWGIGHEGTQGTPNKQGFDEFFGYMDQHHAHNYYPTFLMENENRFPLPNVVPGQGEWGQGVATKKVQYSHDLIMERSLTFVRDHKDQPFFMYLAVTLPHANNEAGNKGMEIPSLGQYADKEWTEPAKGHAAMVSHLDSGVGQLVDLLKELDLADDTLIFFTSDNGSHAEGGYHPGMNKSSGPLNSWKRSLLEGGIRVPTIVWSPGEIQPGSVSDHPAAFWDVMATFAQAGGCQEAVPKQTDGISFWPTLIGDMSQQRKHDYLYWEFYEGGQGRAIRMGNWKIIQQPLHSELRVYDLDSDLGEQSDLASSHPELLQAADRIFSEAHTPSNEFKFRPKPVKADKS